MARRVYVLTSLISLSACGHIASLDTPSAIETYSGTEALPSLPAQFEGGATFAASDSELPYLLDWVDGLEPSGELRDYVSTVLNDNPSIQIVRAAKEQAAAGLKRNEADRLPFFQYVASRTGTYNPGNNNAFLQTDDLAFIGQDSVQASWEIDLWGRLGAAVKSGEASLVAAEFDLYDMQVSLTGQAIIAWLNHVAILRRLDVNRNTLTARERVLKLTERRLLEGATTALDVRTARSALAGAQAAFSGLAQSEVEAARALNALMGQYPSAMVNMPESWPVFDAMTLPVAPLSLLARRPDVASAEQSLIAAGFDVDRARTALFPSLSLTGNLSDPLTSFADNLNFQEVITSIVASFSQTLFDGGARRAQIQSAEAAAKRSLGAYLNTALTALNEVENALTAEGYLNQQISAQTIALDEAIAAERIAERNYVNGLNSVFELINAQTTRLSTDESLINLELARATNRVNYYVALGGGLVKTGNRFDDHAEDEK